MFQIETVKKVLILALLLGLSACKPGDSSSPNNNTNNTNTDPQGDPPMCVLPACAAPPEGCNWENPQIVDGCQVNCGNLVCEKSCDIVADCPAPPEGCRYENPGMADGCPLTCGTLVCDEFCPMMLCPAIAAPCLPLPPERDDSGCPICGPPIVCLTE